jgi:hypothetical protein
VKVAVANAAMASVEPGAREKGNAPQSFDREASCGAVFEPFFRDAQPLDLTGRNGCKNAARLCALRVCKYT